MFSDGMLGICLRVYYIVLCVRKAPESMSLIDRALYKFCKLLLTHVWIRPGAMEDNMGRFI